MIRGLYTSGWSMLANSKQMDVVSNNLANVNTTAFKKDTLILESFPDMLVRRINDSRSASNPSGRLGNVQLGNDVGEVFTYYTQGQLQKTDNNLDMAISNCDTAFFTVAVPGGTESIQSTIQGRFFCTECIRATGDKGRLPGNGPKRCHYPELGEFQR